ncbi:MAG TPA: leucyl/phenylalanyl-tRNA--protein transferase [Gammaproteobacteria bacterium]|nr:leucyl/phenylalanyl-tRNA--protein transferase [Gammaproteobacteria bacterium]
MESIFWIDEQDASTDFPPVSQALKDPEGLLAAGGALTPERLMKAYRSGIFPWFEEGQPVLWWSPDPRCIIYTRELHISRSLKKTLRNKPYTVSFNQAFPRVIEACAEPRKGSSGTWITSQMKDAYIRLHEQGKAQSVEVWNADGELVGGLYGILLDKVFSGESMFSRERDMSKVALVYLAQWLEARQIRVIDCQLPNPHLERLGAVLIPREEFVKRFLRA